MNYNGFLGSLSITHCTCRGKEWTLQELGRIRQCSGDCDSLIAAHVTIISEKESGANMYKRKGTHLFWRILYFSQLFSPLEF
jgi:hypothetical protein